MSHLQLCILGDCRVDVEGNQVTPAASHLFGLLLLLALRQGKPISRQELQTLLLVDGPTPTIASHNLRQLLYRLRQMGVRLQEMPSGLALCDTEVVGPLEQLRQMDVFARSRLTLPELELLPSYVPRLPRPFTIWLDEVKNDLDAEIRLLLLADLETLRASHAWLDVIRLSDMLSTFDEANSDVVRARAEALAMTGRREEALQTLDRFTRATVLDADTAALMQCVRTRIAKTTIARREGTLRARGSCLAFLDGEWAKLPSGGARMTAVVAPAGLGKTRVADEFAARISFRGGHVVRFDCDSQSQQQPLALFSHILPAVRAMRGSLGASPEYKSALAVVRPTVDSEEMALPEGISLEARRADIQSALIDLLEAVSAERPLLLVVDDAHLLDDASRAVLRALTTTRNAAMLQVLVCARPTSGNTTLLAPARRSSVFELAPLSADDSRELLLELSAGLTRDDEYIAWSLEQAAGNPFYLHQLASHPTTSSTSLPFDLSLLAVSSYSALRPDSRTVLECCLLLGRFATLGRAMCVAGIDDRAMLGALRELEEQDLVHYVDGLLSGPHALLHDALRELIPTSVSALLHRRIAEKLEEDCVAEQFTPSLAWASAQSWLAAGDPAAATRLLRRCASHAASLGEPAAAAELLSQVPLSALPLTLQGELLDDLSRFAGAGGRLPEAAKAVRSRLLLARQLSEGADQIKMLQLRLVEADLFAGAPTGPAVEALTELLVDTSAKNSLRVQASLRLLIIADGNLDSILAEHAHSIANAVGAYDSLAKLHLARAELVYHTTFGDIDHANLLALRLLHSFPEPGVSAENMRTRTYAAFSLVRMGHADLAKSILEANYNYLFSHGMHGEALYSASLRTELAIAAGDFDTAFVWLSRCESASRGISPHELNPDSGFAGNAGVLAMRAGRFDEAEMHFRAPQQRYALLTGARYTAYLLAMLLRVEQLRSGTNLKAQEVSLLGNLYVTGRHLGGQDPIVEALWCALTLNGDAASASQLLTEYLCIHRRERSLPEWSLRHATAADDAWQAYYARTGAPSRPT